MITEARLDEYLLDDEDFDDVMEKLMLEQEDDECYKYMSLDEIYEYRAEKKLNQEEKKLFLAEKPLRDYWLEEAQRSWSY